MFELPASKQVTTIYKGTIEALNPLPDILKDKSASDDQSLRNFERKVAHSFKHSKEPETPLKTNRPQHQDSNKRPSTKKPSSTAKPSVLHKRPNTSRTNNTPASSDIKPSSVPKR
jgi:hypothetical protein